MLNQCLLQEVPAWLRLLLALQQHLEQLCGTLQAPGGVLRPTSLALTIHLQVLEGKTQVGLQGGGELSCQ